MVDANRTIEERLDKIERLLTRGQKQSRRDLGLLAIQANLTDFGMTALLCGACVLVVGGVKIGAELRATAKENMPAWAYNAIWGWAGDFAVAGDLAVDGISSGEYASPIVGKSLQDLVSYQPSHGQSFGPETGNMRSYGPHAGVDFDCRVGGCTGADVASPISGTVSRIHQIGTSANGGSFQLEITGEDWAGKVTHQLVHVDNIKPRLGEYVKAGQVVAKVSPTDTVSTGPHLDWKIQRNGQWENPQKWAAKAMEQNASSSKDTLQDAISLIKNFEGFHPTPYWDYEQYSWGYGTRAPGPSGTIDKAAAEQELVAYLDRNCLPLINPMGLPSNQGSALASLCYNIGPGQFQQSEVFLHASQGDHNSAASAFMNWTKAGGSVLPGLVTRRQREKAVYSGGF